LQIRATRLVDYMPAFVDHPNYDWKSRLFFFGTMARLKPEATRAGAAAELTRLNRLYLQSSKIDHHATDVELADGSAGLQSSAKLAVPLPFC
jgi:hypothetical protein